MPESKSGCFLQIPLQHTRAMSIVEGGFLLNLSLRNMLLGSKSPRVLNQHLMKYPTNILLMSLSYFLPRNASIKVSHGKLQKGYHPHSLNYGIKGILSNYLSMLYSFFSILIAPMVVSVGLISSMKKLVLSPGILAELLVSLTSFTQSRPRISPLVASETTPRQCLYMTWEPSWGTQSVSAPWTCLHMTSRSLRRGSMLQNILWCVLSSQPDLLFGRGK